jgi:hypothetical protein
MIPDPVTDPTATVSLLSHLYSTGAFFCLGVVVLYLALKYASKHVAWLEVPGRAHYVTVAIAVLAVFAVPASQGTTPNTSMLMVAFGTAMSLLLPGAPKVADALPSAKVVGKGFARFDVMFTLAALAGAAFAWIVVLHLQGCATFKAMSGDFAVCEKADLGQLVKNEEGQLVPLATAVAELAEGNPADLEAQALALIKTVGVDAVDCAKVAYEDTHPAGSGSAVGAIAKPSLARLNAVIAAARKAK